MTKTPVYQAKEIMTLPGTKKGGLYELSGKQTLLSSGLAPGLNTRRASTLIELLVVIAIIAILAAILMPVLQKAEERARVAQCLSNKKQMALGWVMYTTDNNDWVMPNADESVSTSNAWVNGTLKWAANTVDNTNTYLLQTSIL